MNYSGQYGLVLIPNSVTSCMAEVYAATIQNNLVHLENEHPAHMTLYHTKVTSLDDSSVSEIMSKIKTSLRLNVRFKELASFGGKFAFWDAEKNQALVEVHEKSLELSKYFNPEDSQQADSEDIELSRKEAENVKLYGHPLVRELWRPHITVGYVEGGLELCIPAPFDGCFVKVAFVRVGPYGTISEIVKQI